MDCELYRAAKEGKVEFLDEPVSFVLRTHQGNNIIHIAARIAGNETFIGQALNRFPDLVDQANTKGDTPLHVAARFGHASVVKVLTSFKKPRDERIVDQDMSPSSQEEDGRVLMGTESSNSMPTREIDEEVVPAEDVVPPLWRVTNLEGTTALHEALRNRHEEVSLYLLELDPELACFVNGAGESPLYLAAESTCEEVLKKILESGLPYSVDGPHGQNPFHAAKYCSGSSIELLLGKRPELASKADDRGKTILHYAIEGSYSGPRNQLWLSSLLLQKDPSLAYIPDGDGLTPLLRASSIGSFQLCNHLIKCCPESTEALDKNGQNALHLFKVQKGKFLDAQRFLKIPEVRELINERDNEGNTPIHLAIKNRENMMVKLLLRTNTLDLRATNKEGLTALDICESDWKHSYKQRRMWFHLKINRAQRGRHPNQWSVPIGGPKTTHILPDADWKQMASTLSVVAALLATVTFTAAFTMPGGYNSNGDNLGVAVLIKKAALQVFVLADTFAMCCSITVVFFLIWAMIGEPELLRALTNISRRLLKLALYGTLVAFVSGLYSVIAPEAMWVAILVCIMGSIVPFVVRRDAIMGWATGVCLTCYSEPQRGHVRGKRKRNKPTVKNSGKARILFDMGNFR